MKYHVDGRRLQKLRQEVGLTQEELARRVGISRSTVVAIENDYHGTIEKLSFSLVEAWVRACRKTLSPSILEEWEIYIKKLLGIDN